jgi:hypothetical protein
MWSKYGSLAVAAAVRVEIQLRIDPEVEEDK